MYVLMYYVYIASIAPSFFEDGAFVLGKCWIDYIIRRALHSEKLSLEHFRKLFFFSKMRQKVQETGKLSIRLYGSELC